MDEVPRAPLDVLRGAIGPAASTLPDVVRDFARADTALQNIGRMLAVPVAQTIPTFDAQMDGLVGAAEAARSAWLA